MTPSPSSSHSSSLIGQGVETLQRSVSRIWRRVGEINRRSLYRTYLAVLSLIRFVLHLFRKYYATLIPLLLISVILMFPDQFRSLIQYWGFWGKVAVFFLFFIRCFSLIGFSVLGGATSYLYGFQWGFVLFFTGSILGCCFQYFLVRYRWIKVPGETILKQTPSPKSMRGVIFVRLIPLFPFDLVTLRVAYDDHIKFGQFLRGTFFGSLPWFLFICASVDAKGSEVAVAAAITVGQVILWITVFVAVAVLFVLGTQR